MAISKKENQFELIINKETFLSVLEDFIFYKVKCISSIEYFILKNHNISNINDNKLI